VIPTHSRRHALGVIGDGRTHRRRRSFKRVMREIDYGRFEDKFSSRWGSVRSAIRGV